MKEAHRSHTAFFDRRRQEAGDNKKGRVLITEKRAHLPQLVPRKSWRRIEMTNKKSFDWAAGRESGHENENDHASKEEEEEEHILQTSSVDVSQIDFWGFSPHLNKPLLSDVLTWTSKPPSHFLVLSRCLLKVGQRKERKKERNFSLGGREGEMTTSIHN
jgi:hypothetical protein